MALDSVLAPLTNLQTWVAAHRMAAVRMLVLMGLWGLALFGYASLGEQALQQRLPPVQAAMEAHAQAVATYLNSRMDMLAPLAADPRIPQGLASDEGLQSLDVRRALYEFGYINRVTQLYVWDETTQAVVKLAGSTELPAALTQHLPRLQDAERALISLDKDNQPALYAAVHITPKDAAHAYVVMPLGLSPLMGDVPMLEGLAGQHEPTRLLAVDEGGVWQFKRGVRAKPNRVGWATPKRLTGLDVVSTPEGLMVTAPLPALEGWAVALPLPPAMALGTSRYAQWGVLAAALLASLVLLWKPSLPLRRTLATKLQPMVRVINPLIAPILGSVAAVVSGKAQPAQPTKVDLREVMDEASAPARRARSMNLGGPAKPRIKPSGPTSYVPALKASLKAEGIAVPDAPVEAPPQDSMAALVDECFKQERSQLLYQPVYSARTGQPVMHEVLLRLVDREGQSMTPAVFIPICQQYGWMERLDAHVAKRVFELNFAGDAVPSTPLALNLAGASMENIGYMEGLMLQATPTMMAKLVFEVRSHELMEDPKALVFLKNCREMGARLSVDYFGGGAGMVEVSKKMGFDYIKMDCTRFGSDVMAKKELIMLCRAAQKVDLPVILEKMETVEMEVYARRIGVHYLQGYLLGKPKPDLVTGPLPGWSAMAKADDAVPPATVEDPPADAPPPDAPDSPSK
ncbi:MAG: EAL domain-containing protein [Alphaproteobacteria bacterium]